MVVFANDLILRPVVVDGLAAVVPVGAVLEDGAEAATLVIDHLLKTAL